MPSFLKHSIHGVFIVVRVETVELRVDLLQHRGRGAFGGSFKGQIVVMSQKGGASWLVW